MSFKAVVVLSGSTPRSKPKLAKAFYERNEIELLVRHATKRRFDLRLVLREAKP